MRKDIIKKLTKENLLIFIKKHKFMLTLFLSTAFLFFSTLFFPLIYVTVAIICFGTIFFDLNETLCLLLYETMFGCFWIISISTIILVGLKISYILFKDLKYRKIKFSKNKLICLAIVFVGFSIIQYKFDVNSLIEGFIFIGFVYLLLILAQYGDKINKEKCFCFLFLGLLISFVLSIIIYLIPNTATLVYDDKLYFEQLKNIVFLEGETKRFSMFSYNVNHLSSMCSFMIAFAISKIIFKKVRVHEYINYCSMIFLSVAIGLLTLSKAFFVVLLIEGLIVLFMIIRKYKKRSIKITCIIVVIILPILLIFRNNIFEIINRFFIYSTDTLLSTITTGRSTIWQKYCNAIIESPLKLLFGFGLFSEHIVFIGPHNFYLFLLFRFGLVGLFFLGLMIYYYLKNKNIKFNINNSFVFIVFLIIGLQETCIDERLYVLILALLLMFEKKEPKKEIV